MKINLCSQVFRNDNFAGPRFNVILLNKIWPNVCVCVYYSTHHLSLLTTKMFLFVTGNTKASLP